MRRLAAALLTSTLALSGVALAPAQAADDASLERALPGELPPLPPAEQPTQRAIVKDPAGDSEGNRKLRKAADLRRVSYRMPAAAGGTMRISTTWQSLRNGNRPGVVRQEQTTVLGTRSGGRGWVLVLTNKPAAPVRLLLLSDDSVEPTPIQPEQLSVSRSHGSRGTLDVTLSTEWLDARQVFATTYGGAGSRDQAIDFTGLRFLRAGAQR